MNVGKSMTILKATETEIGAAARRVFFGLMERTAAHIAEWLLNRICNSRLF
jgi:hypothetical protein